MKILKTKSNLISRGRRLTAGALVYSMFFLTLAISTPAQKNKISPVSGKTDQQPISEQAQLQIQSLIEEKESRTPAQQKIDSQLLYAVKMRRGEAISALVPSLQVNVGADADGVVVVDVTAIIDDGFLAKLKEIGVDIISSSAEYHTLRAKVSLDMLETVAAFPQVRFIQPKQESFTNGAETPAVKPAAANFAKRFSAFSASRADVKSDRIGNVLSSLNALGIGDATNLIPNGYLGYGVKNAEGVIAHQVYSARGTFNTDGTGIRIGVLSDSVRAASLAASQATGDLPPTCSSPTPPATEKCVQIVPGQAGSQTSGDEGTAMLEIVHDIAPGAQLYFATANTNIVGFAANIRQLRTVYNCDVIVDDVGYFVESDFQDGQGPLIVSNTNGGVVTQAVNDVTALGAMYFSSAANSGNKNDGTSGTWEGDFVNGGTSTVITGGNLHDFDPSAAVAQSDVLTLSGGSVPITLQWSDPLGGSSNDYDLFLLNTAGTTVLNSSTNIQTGTQDPYETTSIVASANNRLAILQKTGAANRFLHLNTNRGRLSFNTQGETHGHSAASGGYGVAATPAYSPFNIPQFGPYPGIFTGTSAVETFSSDGPRQIFYNGDGTVITPGNVSSTGGTILQQPLITAADGEEVTGNTGFANPFFGTSAAAPTAAAIAGLLKGANPVLTQAQIKTALTTTAVDIETAGTDRDAGFGIINAYQSAVAAGLTGKAFIEFNGYTATESGGNGNGLIQPNENGTMTINLKNTGLLGATAITTTLTTTTPNVIVTQDSSAYSNLAASGGAANNTTTYSFKLNGGVPPDQIVNFNLTVNYGGGWNASQVINFNVQTGRQPISTNLDATAPPTSTSFPANATGTQTTRISRVDPGSSCGTAKAYPGSVAAVTANYDAYTITNPSIFPVCATITLMIDKTATGSIQAVAYSGSYNPANVATNYLGDLGASPTIGYSKSFGVTVPGSGTIVVVVDNTAPPAGSGTGGLYSLQVSGVPVSLVTAAATSVSGRVSAGGAGIARAKVTLTDRNGAVRTAVTNSFGYFRFDNVEAGNFYVFQATASRYRFSPQGVNVNSDLTDLDFAAE